MRWLVVHPGPEWSVADVHRGWVEALRAAGQQVHEFNLGDRLAFYDHAMIDIGDAGPDGQLTLRKAVTADQAQELAVNGLCAALWKIQPEVMLVITGYLIPNEILDQARRYGTHVVVHHTEQPYELKRESTQAAHADLNLINDPLHMETFAAIAPTVYCPHAYRPSIHYPGPGEPRYKSDFVFVGTGFGSRRWFFEHMDFGGADVLLGGNWNGLTEESPLFKYIGAEHPGHCLDNDITAQLYRSAKVGMNLYRREAEDDTTTGGVALGPREVEMAACGLFFLRDPRPESNHVLGMLPAFNDPGEASELLQWYLKHEDVRASLAVKAREAIEGRTFDNHAAELLRLLDKQGVS